MDPVRSPKGNRLVWHDVPLPGTHKCLTWQLNVTIHPPLRSAKFVSILRDPDVQLELSRAGTGLEGDLALLTALSEHLLETVAVLRELAGIPENTPD